MHVRIHNQSPSALNELQCSSSRSIDDDDDDDNRTPPNVDK
jgi:hypothetical protein